MKKKKNELRKIPTKNYFILLVIAICTVILTFYINAWIKTYKDNLYSESPLSGKVKEVNINELKEPFYEINEVILYVGYTNDEKLYNEEKRMLKLIKKKDIADKVVYLNITSDSDYQSILEKRFGNERYSVKRAPMFIYITDGTTEEIVNVKKVNKLTRKFKKLINKYDIEDNY